MSQQFVLRPCAICGAGPGEVCVGWVVRVDGSAEPDGFDGDPCQFGPYGARV